MEERVISVQEDIWLDLSIGEELEDTLNPDSIKPIIEQIYPFPA